MLINDDLDFVKGQAAYHARRAEFFTTTKKDQVRADRHTRLSARFQALHARMEEVIGSEQEGGASKDPETTSEMRGGLRAIPAPSRLRIGDLDRLPEELRKQLSITKSDKLETHIIDVINDKFGGVAAIDEILVGLYDATGEVHERNPLSTKLYRMTKKGLLNSLPKKKGVYTTFPVESNQESEERQPSG